MKRGLSKNRVMCIWLPNWPLQRLRVAHRELKHDVVLYERYRGGSFRVAACDGRHGIKLGMPLAEAMALTRAHFELHDPEADQAALLRLAAFCEQFSPAVGVEGADTLCLDITGLAPLFSGESALVRQVKQEFTRLRLDVRLAIGDTLGTAWAIAHFGEEIAAIAHGYGAIAKLPVVALRLSDDLIDRLAELGCLTIGQLLKLPRSALASRFDLQLLQRLDEAAGIIAEPIVSHRPPPEIVAETTLEYPVDNRNALNFILRELIERVSQALLERQQGAIRIECRAKCERGEPISIFVGLYRPSANPRHLLELAQMQLDQLVLPGPISAVTLSVLLAARLAPSQQELFELSRQEGRRQVALLVDRMSNRLGRNRVLRAVFQTDAQPELAFRYEPLTGVTQRKQKEQRPKQLPRPLRLEREPVPLDVLSVVPHGPPVQFDWQGFHRVARAWGPERIQYGWWRGRYVQRDYYRVETTTGRRFWLFRRLQDGKWFLHGAFD